jgi:hypothetical protein
LHVPSDTCNGALEVFWELLWDLLGNSIVGVASLPPYLVGAVYKTTNIRESIAPCGRVC